jgi:hypothetical protein
MRGLVHARQVVHIVAGKLRQPTVGDSVSKRRPAQLA